MPKKGIPSICEFKSGRQVCTHIPLDPSPGFFIVGRILKLVAALIENAEMPIRAMVSIFLGENVSRVGVAGDRVH